MNFKRTFQIILICALEISCSSSDKTHPENGIYRKFYKNGSPRTISLYKNGKLDGIKKDYYQNGTLKSVTNYVNGIIAGENYYYYDNGIIQRYVFSDPAGKLEKKGNLYGALYVREYDEAGSLIKEEGEPLPICIFSRDPVCVGEDFKVKLYAANPDDCIRNLCSGLVDNDNYFTEIGVFEDAEWEWDTLFEYSTYFESPGIHRLGFTLELINNKGDTSCYPIPIIEVTVLN